MARAPQRPPRDAQATRARLLAAARREFAAWGFDGARIERIADEAQNNKRMIYEYFGSKDGLFRAVVDGTIDAQLEQVPFTPDDLPAYAVAYFDQLVADPDAVRLVLWRASASLEPSASERESYARKVAAIRRAQHEGTVVSSIAAIDVLAMLFALARSWLTAAAALRDASDENAEAPARLEEHRRGLELAVRRAFVADASGA